MKSYIEDMLAKGFIGHSKSSNGSPCIFVPKKNGKLRMCADYRRLNQVTKKNVYPLPLISELIDKFKDAKWFTKLDLKNRYNLIRIKEGAKGSPS
jgi:hypothetical protein